MPWNPDVYAKFRDERAAPFFDLLRGVTAKGGLDAVDLGCGDGALTARLADALPDSRVLGVDASKEMLARALPRARPGLRFEEGDIALVDGGFDLVFSNAALQWLPNHRALLGRLWGLVRPRGQIAVQVPSNFDHPSHRLLAQTAETAPFAAALGGWTREGAAPVGERSPVLGIVEYGERLFGLGGTEIAALEKIYPALLPDADGVLEWVSGTALVPYLERLPNDLRDAFRDAYREKLWRQWPSGPVFYAFKRTLFWATKPG